MRTPRSQGSIEKRERRPLSEAEAAHPIGCGDHQRVIVGKRTEENARVAGGNDDDAVPHASAVEQPGEGGWREDFDAPWRP
jgi:hypothetical protein